MKKLVDEPTTDSVVPPFRRGNRANPKRRKAATMEVRSSEAVIGAVDMSELRTEEVVCKEYFKIESPWKRAKPKVEG